MMFRNNIFDCSDPHGRLKLSSQHSLYRVRIELQDSQALEFNPLSRTFERSPVLSALKLPRPVLDIEP
jgi:hypothetical protein